MREHIGPRWHYALHMNTTGASRSQSAKIHQAAQWAIIVGAFQKYLSWLAYSPLWLHWLHVQGTVLRATNCYAAIEPTLLVHLAALDTIQCYSQKLDGLKT